MLLDRWLLNGVNNDFSFSILFFVHNDPINFSEKSEMLCSLRFFNLSLPTALITVKCKVCLTASITVFYAITGRFGKIDEFYRIFGE